LINFILFSEMQNLQQTNNAGIDPIENGTEKNNETRNVQMITETPKVIQCRIKNIIFL
jgi:hypothetical protein